MLVGKRKRYGFTVDAVFTFLLAVISSFLLGQLIGIVLFGQMSDSFWMSLFGFLATAFGLWLTYKKAADAQDAAAKAKVNAEEAARTAASTGDNTAAAIKQVSEANKEQHVKMNSQLDEMKKVIASAAREEGVRQGRLELKAEQNAEAAARARGAREAAALSTQQSAGLPAASNVVDEPVPVQVIPADDPLPVEVKVVLPKGMAVKQDNKE